MGCHDGYILVVEDDAAIRQIVAETLAEELGHAVWTAENGRVALDMLRGPQLPTLILLDIMMPVMNGLEFLEERNRNPVLGKVPVCVMTASNQPMMLPGVAAVLAKAFSVEALIAVVERHCCRRASIKASEPAARGAVSRAG